MLCYQGRNLKQEYLQTHSVSFNGLIVYTESVPDLPCVLGYVEWG